MIALKQPVTKKAKAKLDQFYQLLSSQLYATGEFRGLVH